MKKSKIIALLMVVIMLFSVTACSAEQQPQQTEVQASADDAMVTENGLDISEEVEIIMYVVSDEMPGSQAMIDNFNVIAKEKLNCTLKVNFIGWGEYSSRYPLLFSSGEKFDLAYAGNWLDFASLAQRGAFMNLDELWPTYAPNNFAQQSETAKQQATIDGSYYCVPTLFATYSAYGPVYRTDIVDETDFSGTIETFEDYEKYMDAVVANTDFEGVNINSAGSDMDDVFMFNNGLYSVKGATNDFLWIDPTQENPEVFTFYEYEKTPEFLDMMSRWNEKGFFGKSALSDTLTEKFTSEISASELGNLTTYETLYAMLPEANVQYANLVSDVSTLSYTQDALVVSNTSENPERALALYDLITSDEEAFMAFYYGVEGVDYELTEDNQLTWLDWDNCEPTPLWGARTPEFDKPAAGSPQEVQTLMTQFNSKIEDGVGTQKYRSFVLDTSEIETEYAACQSVHQQYWWPLELGYTDKVAGLEEYKAQMESAGIDVVRAAVQEQINAYLAGL